MLVATSAAVRNPLQSHAHQILLLSENPVGDTPTREAKQTERNGDRLLFRRTTFNPVTSTS